MFIKKRFWSIEAKTRYYSMTFKSGIETRTPTIHGAKRKQQKQSGEKQGDGEKQHEEAFTPNKPRDPFETPTTTTRRSIPPPPPLRGIAVSFSSGAEAVAVILRFTHGRNHQLKVVVHPSFRNPNSPD